MAVYFIHDSATGMLKIGWANDPWQRFSKIQSDCPGVLKILAIEDGDAEREGELHRQFHADRVRGEWFRYSGPLSRYVEMLGPARRLKTYKTPKAEMIARLRVATGAGFPTCSSWVERNSIPGRYWKAIADAGIYTLEELAERHAASMPEPYVRKYPQRKAA